MSFLKLFTPRIIMDIGGNDFSSKPLKEFVSSIEVECESDGVSAFTVKLLDKGGKFSSADTSIKEGHACKITLGSFEHGVEQLIDGYVTSVKADHKQGKAATYEIKGYDGLHRLVDGGRQRKSWDSIKDSDLASIIASKHGLGCETDDSGTINPYVAQNNVNDLTFMQERAKHIGFELKVEGKTMIFKKRRLDTEPVKLCWNIADIRDGEFPIKELNVGSDNSNVPNRVIVRSYDPKTGSAIISEAKYVDGGTMGGTETGNDTSSNKKVLQISDTPVYSTEEAEKLAKSILDERVGKFVDGKCKCLGHPKLTVGRKVSIRGIGSMEGEYYVVKATHKYTASGNEKGYWTEFSLSRNARQ